MDMRDELGEKARLEIRFIFFSSGSLAESASVPGGTDHTSTPSVSLALAAYESAKLSRLQRRAAVKARAFSIIVEQFILAAASN